MPIVGTGIDLVRISRFERFVAEEKTALLERVFTDQEREYSLSRKAAAAHLAARFAAKEAFLKALGTGLRFGLSWQEIEVVRNELGRPSLVVTGKALELLTEAGATKTHLSYSHDGDYAVASVILEA